MKTNLYRCYKNCYEEFALLKNKKGLLVKLIQVKGHSGLYGNEEADRLATLALIEAGLKH